MIILYKYRYVGEEPRDFPTIGKRNVKKGDEIESAEELGSPFLQEIVDTQPVQQPVLNEEMKKEIDEEVQKQIENKGSDQ